MAKKVKTGPVPKDDRHARFAAEYLIDGNATQAAIRAGYSPRTAKVQGSRLLTYADVQAFIKAGSAKIATKLEITAERVIQELGRIGFSDIRKAASWRTVVGMADGEDGEASPSSLVDLVDSDKLDDDTAAAISEVSMTRYGPKLKFYDKRAALVDLGKVTGVFKDGAEPTEPVRFIVEWAK